MEFNITDQLVKGFHFNTTECNFSDEILISEATINTLAFGIYYNNGVLTIDDRILANTFNVSSNPELYIDDNKILKLK